MGLMDRIKKVTGTEEGYDDTYDDDYYNGFDSYDEEEDDSDVQFAPPAGQSQAQNQQQMNMGSNAGGSISFSGANVKMQVVRPQSYDSETTSQIANHLLNKCTVLLNLENTNKETSRRLIDFLTGVAYSIGGDLKKIATNTYVIAPSNVDVENAQLRQNARRQDQQQNAPKDNGGDDFGDFN